MSRRGLPFGRWYSEEEGARSGQIRLQSRGQPQSQRTNKSTADAYDRTEQRNPRRSSPRRRVRNPLSLNRTPQIFPLDAASPIFEYQIRSELPPRRRGPRGSRCFPPRSHCPTATPRVTRTTACRPALRGRRIPGPSSRGPGRGSRRGSRFRVRTRTRRRSRPPRGSSQRSRSRAVFPTTPARRTSARRHGGCASGGLLSRSRGRWSRQRRGSRRLSRPIGEGPRGSTRGSGSRRQSTCMGLERLAAGALLLGDC